MLERLDDYSPPAGGDTAGKFEFLTARKNNKKNKRRFSDEQIKSLETIFESESKLEPRMKLQLARELGLQPRQVAIWFQNRRARWKSKQLERDYSTLRANYESLASRFESVKKEKQSLVVQLQKLTQLHEKHHEGSRFDFSGNSTDGVVSDNRVARCEAAEAKSSLQQEEAGDRGMLSSPDENRKVPGYLGEEEPDLNMVKPQDGTLTLPENWYSFDSKDLFSQSCTGSQWWDFWT